MKTKKRSEMEKPTSNEYPTVSPWITTGNTAKLIEFLQEAFDAVEVEARRIVGEDGTIAHAEVRIGDSVILMFDAPTEWPTLQALLRLYVPDADQTFKRAVSAGAEIVTMVTTLPSGERVGRVRDPFGNIWWIQSRTTDIVENESHEEMQDPCEQESIKYVEQSLEWELGKNVQHPAQLNEPKFGPCSAAS